jgi:hypothetical protein
MLLDEMEQVLPLDELMAMLNAARTGSQDGTPAV